MKTYISNVDNVWYAYEADTERHSIYSVKEVKYPMFGVLNAKCVKLVGKGYGTKAAAVKCARRNGDYGGEWNVW